MKIVIDRDIPYLRGVLEPFAEVAYIEGSHIGRTDVADADALVVRTRTQCDRALLEGSRVKMVATATIGYDHIDMDYCREADIRVATAAGSNSRGVLQWVGAALAHASGRQGWTPGQRCIGVVGVGNVGSLVANYATQWGFSVLCCDPPRQREREAGDACRCRPGLYEPDMFVPFSLIASECDIITFHTPLIKGGAEATYHMAGEDLFGRLPTRAIVLNSARGGVTDTQAMLKAARSGRCECCLDTWENEPDINREMLRHSMLSTFHIAGYTAQGKANASSMAVRALAAGFGLPLADWYPIEVAPSTPKPISWEEMSRTMTKYFDIEAHSALLRENPEQFEHLRDNYDYRTEYF